MSSKKQRKKAWAVLHGDAYDGESSDAAIAYVSGLEREIEALRVAVTTRDVALRECAEHVEHLRADIQRVREVCEERTVKVRQGAATINLMHAQGWTNCANTVLRALDGGA